MNKSIILFIQFIILSLGGISQGQTTGGQQDGPPPGFIWKDCNQKGFVDMDGNCLCALGWFGDNCEKNPSTTIPGVWWTFRILMILFFSFFLVVSSIAFFLVPSKKSRGDESAQDRLSFFNVKRFALGSVVLLSLDSLLYYACDPEGFDNAGIPYWVGLLFFLLTWPIISTMFQIVLFHWAEIYYKTIKVLRQEEMLSKINRNYSSNVTLDDILAKVKFVSRFRIPFLILNGIPYILVLMVVIFLSIPSVGYVGFFALPIYQAYCTIMFVLETVGFIIFGRRMTKLMPKPLDRRMKKITTTVSIMAGSFCFGWIFSLIAGYSFTTTEAGYMIASVVSRVITIVIIAAMLSIFFRVVKKRSFLCCLHLKGSQSHSQNSTTGGSSTIKRTIETDMELTTTADGNSI